MKNVKASLTDSTYENPNKCVWIQKFLSISDEKTIRSSMFEYWKLFTVHGNTLITHYNQDLKENIIQNMSKASKQVF